jgi:hypothetical protein
MGHRNARLTVVVCLFNRSGSREIPVSHAAMRWGYSAGVLIVGWTVGTSR